MNRHIHPANVYLQLHTCDYAYTHVQSPIALYTQLDAEYDQHDQHATIVENDGGAFYS